MPAQQRGVGEDAVVAHNDIMAEVRSGHHVIVISHYRDGVGLHRPVNRDVFPKHVVITNHNPADVHRAGNVLRGPSDHHVFAEFIVTSGRHSRFDHRAGRDSAEVTEFRPGLNRGEGANGDPDPEAGPRIHHSQRMDAHGGPFSMIGRDGESMLAGLSARTEPGFNGSFRGRGDLAPPLPVLQDTSPARLPLPSPLNAPILSGLPGTRPEIRLREECASMTREERYAAAEKLKDDGDLAGAVLALEAVIVDEPDYALAHSALGAWCTRLERHEEAVRHARRACELEPKDPFSYTALSVACMRAGLIAEAEDALARSRMLQG